MVDIGHVAQCGGEVAQLVVGGLTTSGILARGSQLPQVTLHEAVFVGR